MAIVYKFPTEQVDRVPRLASALLRVIELSEMEAPEDHMAAILLVQAALQQTVCREKGYAEMRRMLIAATERRRRYEIRYDSPEPENKG